MVSTCRLERALANQIVAGWLVGKTGLWRHCRGKCTQTFDRWGWHPQPLITGRQTLLFHRLSACSVTDLNQYWIHWLTCWLTCILHPKLRQDRSVLFLRWGHTAASVSKGFNLVVSDFNSDCKSLIWEANWEHWHYLGKHPGTAKF